MGDPHTREIPRRYAPRDDYIGIVMADLYREPVDENKTAETPSASLAASLNPVESEIADLEKQLAQKRALLGMEKQQPLERVIGAEKPAPSSSPPANLAPTTPPVTSASAPTNKPETQDLKSLEKNQQLKNLVDLAFQKGITYAADVARELDSAYLMDEFHDTLVDKLHKELVEKGKLEEI